MDQSAAAAGTEVTQRWSSPLHTCRQGIYEAWRQRKALRVQGGRKLPVPHLLGGEDVVRGSQLLGALAVGLWVGLGFFGARLLLIDAPRQLLEVALALAGEGHRQQVGHRASCSALSFQSLLAAEPWLVGGAAADARTVAGSASMAAGTGHLGF